MPQPIQPRRVIEADRVDDERILFPPADRMPHPFVASWCPADRRDAVGRPCGFVARNGLYSNNWITCPSAWTSSNGVGTASTYGTPGAAQSSVGSFASSAACGSDRGFMGFESFQSPRSHRRGRHFTERVARRLSDPDPGEIHLGGRDGRPRSKNDDDDERTTHSDCHVCASSGYLGGTKEVNSWPEGRTTRCSSMVWLPFVARRPTTEMRSPGFSTSLPQPARTRMIKPAVSAVQFAISPFSSVTSKCSSAGGFLQSNAFTVADNVERLRLGTPPPRDGQRGNQSTRAACDHRGKEPESVYHEHLLTLRTIRPPARGDYPGPLPKRVPFRLASIQEQEAEGLRPPEAA